MSRPDVTVGFHIGAHKTATSHLQRSLQGCADALQMRGVRYLGPDYLRQPRQSVGAIFGLKSGLTAPVDPVAQLAGGAHRLVLSEENYIGSLNSPRRKPVMTRYPDAAARIGALAQAIDRPVDVFLAVRRPTSFLNSSYCQQLMGGRVVRMPQFRFINPIHSVDWLDLVQRIRMMPGVGQLNVWCYEDYAAHFKTICATLVGPDAAAVVVPLDRRIHSSLSSAAVAEVLHRHTLRETGDLGFAARRLLPVEDGFAPFDGFTAAEHAAGDAAYRQQVAAIGAVVGVTLLDPLWAAGAMRA